VGKDNELMNRFLKLLGKKNTLSGKKKEGESTMDAF